MHRVLVLADDLTGALEVGAKFAATGLAVCVTTKLDFPLKNLRQEAVVVIDAETRHMEPEEARRRVRDLSRACGEAGFGFVYKKTDSTLRGNIATEISGLLDAFPRLPLFYFPAYPKMGRTVRAGVLYVDGIPVTETSFASDPLNPVKESHIPRLLSAACRTPVISIAAKEFDTLSEAGVYVCDGEADSDLETAALKFAQSGSFRLAAGPAGFIDHVAPLLHLPRTAPSSLPVLRQVLVVNGSHNQASIRQIQHVREHGWPARSGKEIAGAGGAPGWVILKHADSNSSPVEFARRQARTVCSVLEQAEFDALVVFGGDTAYAILEALGNPDLHPLGEVLEGVPISAMRRSAAGMKDEGLLYLVSKAGGFGPVDVLRLIQTKLTRG